MFLSSWSPPFLLPAPVYLAICNQRMLPMIFDKRKVSSLDIDFFDMRSVRYRIRNIFLTVITLGLFRAATRSPQITKRIGRFARSAAAAKCERFSRINFLDNNGQYFSLVKSTRWARIQRAVHKQWMPFQGLRFSPRAGRKRSHAERP
jgi:hypothetical protein